MMEAHGAKAACRQRGKGSRCAVAHLSWCRSLAAFITTVGGASAATELPPAGHCPALQQTGSTYQVSMPRSCWRSNRVSCKAFCKAFWQMRPRKHRRRGIVCERDTRGTIMGYPARLTSPRGY